jgi:3-deoxy-manno-octulosonate cytidylyltransferase (CMP-KDO synthetase)
MKIIGIMPARMQASRFPGKPLYPILGRPMLEHCFLRAKMYDGWDGLFIATCNKEIMDFAKEKDFPAIMTADTHTRALERVAEASDKCGMKLDRNDIVVCVQGDEPMLYPDMMTAAIKPLLDDPEALCTVLGMQIVEEEVFRDPNTLKIIKDLKGNVLYTSRAAIPYCEKLNPNFDIRRIYGIFAFRHHFLKTFLALPASPLEINEACDSNRIMDHGYRQKLAPYPYRPSFSVDSPHDIVRVEKYMTQDSLHGKY